jgi:hypothetical protein
MILSLQGFHLIVVTLIPSALFKISHMHSYVKNILIKIRDSSVGVAAGCMLEVRYSVSDGARHFSVEVKNGVANSSTSLYASMVWLIH